MNIFMIIGTLNFGGAERVLANLANYFSKNHRVKICTLFNRDIVYSLNSNIEIVEGVAEHGVISAIKNIRKEAIAFETDVAVSFLSHVNITTIISLLGSGIPVIVSERNDPYFEPAQLHRKVLRKIIFPFASGYVFQTKEAKEYFSNRIQKAGIVISNPVFVDDVSEDYKSIVDKEKEFVAIGRLTEQKNYTVMIKAFKKVCAKYPEYKLKIYGKGQEKEKLQYLCKEEDVENNVEFMGTVQNVHEKILNSHVFVMSSDHEGMPNALMEAMALGMCCISTDCPCGGPRELIKHGINGFLVPVGDIENLAETMIFTIENKEVVSEIRKRSSCVRKDYDIAQIGKKWEIYLQEVLSKNKR